MKETDILSWFNAKYNTNVSAHLINNRYTSSFDKICLNIIISENIINYIQEREVDDILTIIQQLIINKMNENSEQLIRDFGSAITALKNGYKVAREGWNGKGMFLYHVPANKYQFTTTIGESIADSDGKVEYGAYIAMKTAQGNVVPWLASQTDVLAEDWTVITNN
jgi:hypothetical protein